MIHLIEAGHSYKVYGLKGELIVDLNPSYRKHIFSSAVLFFVIEGNAVPFFIQSSRTTDDLILKFKDVNSPEEARLLSNQVIYIDAKGLVVEEQLESENTSTHFFTNYTIVDTVSGKKARIKSIEEYPSQLMALVEMNSKEYMIPLHEDWIIKIDKKNKSIQLELPEGLFDL